MNSSDSFTNLKTMLHPESAEIIPFGIQFRRFIVSNIRETDEQINTKFKKQWKIVKNKIRIKWTIQSMWNLIFQLCQFWFSVLYIEFEVRLVVILHVVHAWKNWFLWLQISLANLGKNPNRKYWPQHCVNIMKSHSNSKIPFHEIFFNQLI